MRTISLKKLADPFTRLFWQAQIGILRGCPPLCGVTANGTFNAYQNRRLYFKRLLPVAAQVPRALARHWRDKREHRVVLPRVSVIVTMRCTLNCDKCLAHIPDMKHHGDMPTENLLEDIRALFACVDYIYDISLTGGEPLLHPDLDQIIRACADSGKVGHINLVTNGTILPGEKILAALRGAGATVKISRYPAALAPNAQRLKAILADNGIHYIYENGTSWRDMGAFGQLQPGGAARRFRVCVLQLCYVYVYGKLHLCGESAVLTAEKRIPGGEGDYIDLRGANPASFRAQWQSLLKKPVLSACSYCLGQTYQTPKIPVAVQRGMKE